MVASGFLQAAYPTGGAPTQQLRCAVGNALSNNSFEAGDCTEDRGANYNTVPPTFGTTFIDFSVPGGPIPRVSNWQGFATPDWVTGGGRLSPPTCFTWMGTTNNRFMSTGPFLPSDVVRPPIVIAPRTGVNCAGIYAKSAFNNGNTANDGREYIMAQLAQPLQQQRPYFVEYYASLAPGSQFVLRRLQVAFAPTLPQPVSRGNSMLLPGPNLAVVATATNLPNGLNPGWTPVRGVFTPPAGSSYQVMVLGNFVNGDCLGTGPAFIGTTSAMLANRYPADPTNNGAYYYIDDVSLSAFPEAGAPQTLSCPGGNVQLGDVGCPLPAAANATYQWFAGANPVSFSGLLNPTVNVTQTTTYTLLVQAGGQAYTTTTTVTVIGRATAGPSQTIRCGQPAQLGVQCFQAAASYAWAPATGLSNANIANPTANPATTTTYTLTVTQNGQSYAAGTTTVTVQPVAGSNQTIRCGQTAQLGVQCFNAAASYAWLPATGLSNANSANPTANPATTTTYALTVTLNGQTYAAGSTTVTVQAVAGPNQSMVCGQSVQLGVQCPQPGDTYAWTPAYGLSNPNVANPTANPASTVTYALTVTNNGQTYAAGSSTVTVTDNHAYAHTASGASPYDAANYPPPAGQPANQPYEIGYPGQSTVLSGANDFNGSYHVRGPLVLEQGVFTLAPGTVFYVDGLTGPSPIATGCMRSVVGDYTQIQIGKSATLILNGATLTANCQTMWGGLEMVGGDARLFSRAVMGSKTWRQSEISQARVGMLVGNCSSTYASSYDITGTSFLNDTYGVASLDADRAAPGSQVNQCLFSSDLTQRLFPDNAYGRRRIPIYTQVGLLLHGDQRDASYQNNEFSGLSVGAELAAANLTFAKNHLRDCYTTAIRVGSPTLRLPMQGNLTLYSNFLNLPDNPAPGGQINPAEAVLGIEIAPGFVQGDGLSIVGNTVVGDNGPGSPRRQVGLDGELNLLNISINEQNAWRNLDAGVRLMDASGLYLPTALVQNNYFAKCGKGLVLFGQGAAPLSPVVSCNTMEDVDRGIEIERNATVGDLGDPTTAVSNNYLGWFSETIHHEGQYSIRYHLNASSNPQELVRTTSQYVTPYPIYGYVCDPGFQWGLHRQAGGTAQTDIGGLEKIIHDRLATPLECHQYERQLVRAIEEIDGFDQLDTFVRTLPLANDTAYYRLSIYLMEQFRRQGAASRVQDVRAALLQQLGQSPDVKNRVAYFDVAEGLTALAPGQEPNDAAVEQLRAISASGTSFAPVACATLRYFYPELGCGEGSVSAPGQARAGGAARPSQRSQRPAAAVQLLAFPNPAHDLARVDIRTVGIEALPASTVFELVQVVTGRVVLTQPATGATLTVSLAGVPAGVYVGRVVADQRALATCKLVVIH